MIYYLYILPFKDNKHFKIGVSSKNDSRVKQHDNLYGLDFTKCRFYKGSKRNISLIESLLLSNTKSLTCFSSDGHTEIRLLSDLDFTLKEINHFEKSKMITEIHYKEIKTSRKEKSNNTTKSKRVKKSDFTLSNHKSAENIYYCVKDLLRNHNPNRVIINGDNIEVSIKCDDNDYYRDKLSESLNIRNEKNDSFYRLGYSCWSWDKKGNNIINFTLPTPKGLDKSTINIINKTKDIFTKSTGSNYYA